MKGPQSLKPLKRISLIFLTITALGVTSSWLSSCSDTSAATTIDHTNIENRLIRIEAKLGNPGDPYNPNDTVQTMATLTSKLSDDIGIMADRILEMADKIVETEVLIVQVITNQTEAATGTINNLTALKADASPRNITGPKLFQNADPAAAAYFEPTATPFVLKSILDGHNGSNGSLINLVAGGGTPSVAVAPNFNIAATAAAAFQSPYVLLMSNNGLFDGATSTSVIIDNNKTLDTGWSELTAILGVASPAKVYFAVKTVSGGQLSAVSNTLNVTF